MKKEIIERVELLSLLFSKPKDFIKDSILDGEMKEVLVEAFPSFSWDEFDDEEYRKKVYERLDKDYLYLFIGVSNPLASPYHSSYIKPADRSRLMDKPARRNIRLMKKWGMEKVEDEKELPDHIAFTLNIVGELLRHYNRVEEDVLKREIKSDVTTIIEDRQWLEKFKEKIKENEETGFYGKLVDPLIKTFEEIEKSW